MKEVDREWRALTEVERALLLRLLESDFDGADELRRQLETARVRGVSDYNDNWGSIDFEPAGNHAACYLMVEAMAPDSDGVPVELLLHVRDGTLEELEIIKADGTEILAFPPAEKFELTYVSERPLRK